MNGNHVLCLLIYATKMVLTVHLSKDGIVDYHQEGHICYSTDPHYYRTNTRDFGGQKLSPHASHPEVQILNHPNYASQFDMSKSKSCSILHPGFVNIHQDSYRKDCTSPPQQPHVLNQNPQYIHSHHNKYKCQPDSPYPRIPGQCSQIFYKPQASPDLISTLTWGGYEEFSHPRVKYAVQSVES